MSIAPHDQVPVSDLVDIDKIFIDEEFNCRGHISGMDVIELGRDIEAKGLTQPVTIMPHNDEEREATGKEFCMLAGFRRTMAYTVMKWSRIPCTIKPWMEPADRKVMNLLENIQRKELNIMQEARSLSDLHKLGIPREKIAKRLNMSGKWVQVRLYLLDLPKEIQDEAEVGLLNQAQIMDLRSLDDTEEQFEAVKMIKEAREKGEKAPKIKKKVITKGSKKHRDRQQIQERMIALIDLGITPGFWSRCLAWASGETTDIEFFLGAEEFADEIGVGFTIPEEFTKN